ncbi:MAG: hypothetical protein AUG02_06840 [Chloroflexi bacterium 13_1_20CM_2_70_9]|nr:MAG: hypothetical protein AUG02_06840 [Chloroflexi bacterium 13_1_20CM_2_70_9]
MSYAASGWMFRARRKSSTCASACGWLRATRTPSSVAPGTPSRQWRTRMIVSATMRTPMWCRRRS